MIKDYNKGNNLANKKPKSRQFKAKLTCLKRDVNTSSPKVMLKEVFQGDKLFRDHVYVSLSNKLKPLIPDTTDVNCEVDIEFTAQVYKYKGSDRVTKKGLQHIRNLKVL